MTQGMVKMTEMEQWITCSQVLRLWGPGSLQGYGCSSETKWWWVKEPSLPYLRHSPSPHENVPTVDLEAVGREQDVSWVGTGTHRPSLLPIERSDELFRLEHPSVGQPTVVFWEVEWILSFRGRRSRNKVFVGEPADGSLAFTHLKGVLTLHLSKTKSNAKTAPCRDQGTVDPLEANFLASWGHYPFQARNFPGLNQEGNWLT